MLNEACAAFQELRKQGVELGQVSVNVSMRQLRDDRFVDQVGDVLTRHGMRAQALEIEVTESTLAGNQREVSGLLEMLRRMGVRIAIDDFGTGYSSMSVLCELPADILKIDRSFVKRLADERTSRSVVEAIISMAHALGKITVAEGVETSDQVQMLRQLGCDFAQGYFFAPPVPPQEMPAVVARLLRRRHVMDGAAADHDLTRFGT